MTTVKNLLKIKGTDVWSVPISATVRETLQLMAERNIGAVLVMEGDKIAGIFSERDYARHVAQREAMLLDEPISEFMTRPIYYVSPNQTVEECMALMTSKHIRHLPVLDKDRRLVGLISIRDVIKQVLEEKESTIQGLENYILGRGYNG